MPWGWECRAKLVKQNPAKPTERRGIRKEKSPGPQQYEPPEIFCGKGFSKIKRAPAYTFGHKTPVSFQKPVTTPKARTFNIRGFGRSGPFRVTHGVVSPQIDPPSSKMKVPGPGTHAPRTIQIRYKRAPVYSMRPAARPPYQAWDQWTPPPNMYKPPIPGNKPPAYTLGYMPRDLKPQELPGPGEHEPNFNYVRKTKPAFSFGAPFRNLKPLDIPAPNAYCEKKFNFSKRTIPVPSFGIRHTRYLGQQETYLRSSKLDLVNDANK